MVKDNEIGSAIISALKSDDLLSVVKEITEQGVDSFLDPGIMRDLPGVNIAYGLCSAIGAIQNKILEKKLLHFFNQLSGIKKEDRDAMIRDLNSDDKYAGKVGSSILEILDRLESDKKPELAAKCFVSFAKEKISFEELRRVLFALEKVPSFDLEKIKSFSKVVSLEDSEGLDESTLCAFVNAGLGKNNGGPYGGFIVPTKLCEIFIRVCE